MAYNARMSIRRLRHLPLVRHALAILAYLLLSLIVTWPLAGRPFSEALGEDYPGRGQNVRDLWWVKTALLAELASPFRTDMLFYPYGADLYFHTLNLPLGLITLPVQLLFGVVAAYNLDVLFALVLAG